MATNPTGIAPGLDPKEPEPKIVDMRCRNPNCDSMTAIALSIPGVSPMTRMYKCTKCHAVRGVTVGGSVDLG